MRRTRRKKKKTTTGTTHTIVPLSLPPMSFVSVERSGVDALVAPPHQQPAVVPPPG